MNPFFTALHFLTIFPWPRRASPSAADLGAAAALFPLIGILLGVVLMLADFLLQPFAAANLACVVLVALLALLTGALHLDGLGDTFDGIGAGGGSERMLSVMDDSRIGAFGLTAIVLLLFFKIHAIENIDGERWRALLAAPIVGRWGMVLMAFRARPAKPGLGSLLIDQLKTRHVVVATVITCLAITTLLRGIGIAVMVWVAVFALLAKRYFHRRLGGVTGDTFGAVAELSEASVLVILAFTAK